MLTDFLQALAMGGIVGVYALIRHFAARSRVAVAPGELSAGSAQKLRTGHIGALAFQDWLVAGYVVALWTLVALGDGPRRARALAWLTLDAACFFVLLFLARWRSTPKPAANVAYRLALPGAIMTTFAQLHLILPSARGVSFDAEIYAIDKRVFGFEPAEAWDRYVCPATTEWFAFFYYLYFGILLVHVVPMAVFERRMNVMREFSWGIFFVFCVGQLVYVAVPGFGPYRLLSTKFEHGLEGPTFWPLVADTVASFDGAHRTDIFPSLHTAVPTFFTLFSFRHRDKVPFRYTWPILAFVTGNIILATMFLRWHYLLDVIMGLVLATTAFVTSGILPRWEDAERERLGHAPIWRPLFGADPRCSRRALLVAPAPASPCDLDGPAN
ncbi:MAG: phosphatase PAP2 family protein [Myxococcales bacterium]|nr:phosphatase PAP2 family protein [Myxococcales bacterium]